MALRWWFGLTYLLGGAGCMVAAIVWLATGNWAGVYLAGGAVSLLALAWLIHPWGVRRQNLDQTARPAR